MTYENVMVIIPPEMADSDESYTEVVEYVAACTGLGCTGNDLGSGNAVTCDAYFEDNEGNLWRGRLDNPPLPDGSQKYIVNFEKKAGSEA